MNCILKKIALCIENGKIDKNSAYPSDMKGDLGVDELTILALKNGVSPSKILAEGLIIGMGRVGTKFRENKIYIPQVLISAKAMKIAMNHLQIFFLDGSIQRKGKVILGTVEGDLHDIGKNIVSMIVQGNGYEVIDIGVDASAEKFLCAINENPDAYVGMSALLSTTMINMKKINSMIKSEFPDIITFVGGAPLNKTFASNIGADYYTKEPQDMIDILNGLINKT